MAGAINVAAGEWWSVFRHRPDADLKLVCFPYAGGTSAVFRLWHLRLPEQVELAAVRLPGRSEGACDRPVTDWHDLVPSLSAALADMLDRPFVFFGHSLGALLGFEVARWLRRHRRIGPERLLVSGRRAPHLRDDEPPTWNQPDEVFVARLRQLNGTPPEVLESADVLALFAPRLRADFKLAETYRYLPEPPLACPITAFGGTADDETLDGGLDAWRIHTSDRFTTYWLHGDHFFIHSHERELLSLIGVEVWRSRRAARGRP